jgi:argininosuccinate lyase
VLHRSVDHAQGTFQPTGRRDRAPLLGQIEAFERDAERLRDCLNRTDVLPLGPDALAGSTIGLDQEFLARALGFTRVRIDAINDPDFVYEFVFCLAMIGLHLSRLSEDLIIWSTIKFGYIELSDAFSTGSSLMRQKRRAIGAPSPANIAAQIRRWRAKLL